jgi:uncharacterized protein YecE (DUF72 family)
MPNKQKVEKVRKQIIKTGMRVRVVNSPHAAVPNGTEAVVVKVRLHAQGLGEHLYQLDLSDLRVDVPGGFRYDELLRL